MGIEYFGGRINGLNLIQKVGKGFIISAFTRGMDEMDELKQYKERLHIALTSAKICIFEVDLIRQLYTFFENAEAIFGVSDETILNAVRPYSMLDAEAYRLAVSAYFSHPDDEEVIAMAFRRILNGEPTTYEARMKVGDSKFIWCRLHMTPILENGVPSRMIGVVTDISDEKERTDSLEQAAVRDSFTGLYNKNHSITLIDHVLQEEREHQHALIVMDIDNFKKFNDTYGHHEGDKIILGVARHIKNVFRREDIAGRFGGDEFIILVREIDGTKGLRKRLKDMTYLMIEGAACTNSVGVSLYPQDGKSFQELFKKADMALYQAKIQKERFMFYSEIEKSKPDS